MADKTHIEWTDATWNPVTGCSVVSPGCTNCYAMKLAGGRLHNHPSRAGLTVRSKAGPVWSGEVRLNEEWLEQPLKWTKPRRIFVCAHGDLFHESVPTEWIAWVYGVAIAAVHCHGHTFQVLTKRAARARVILSDPAFWEEVNSYASHHAHGRATLDDYGPDRPPPGIWLGVSVEDQACGEERIPELQATPAAVRWISVEPLLGDLDLPAIKHWVHCDIPEYGGPGHEFISCLRGGGAIDWVVVGGESGPGARPMHPNWVRRIRNDCSAAGVPFFFKQWGEFLSFGDRSPCFGRDHHGRINAAQIDGHRYRAAPGVFVSLDQSTIAVRVGKRAAGRTFDSTTYDAYPEKS